jgi:protein-S-isoprenylcysteine O-methyltransferase Ste14
MIPLVYWRKTTLEERILGKSFGTEFEDHRRETWALIPMLF